MSYLPKPWKHSLFDNSKYIDAFTLVPSTSEPKVSWYPSGLSVIKRICRFCCTNETRQYSSDTSYILLGKADTSRPFLAGLVPPSTSPLLGGLSKNLGGMCQQGTPF